jgi:hypothetical protein
MRFKYDRNKENCLVLILYILLMGIWKFKRGHMETQGFGKLEVDGNHTALWKG